MPARAWARFLPCRPAPPRCAALIRCRGSCASARAPRTQADLAALVDQKHAVLAGGKDAHKDMDGLSLKDYHTALAEVMVKEQLIWGTSTPGKGAKGELVESEHKPFTIQEA